MKGPFRRIFPGEGRQLFDGGKNSKYEKSIIPDNESPDCANVVFTNGAVETRPGYTRLNTTSVGSFVNHGLYTRKSDAGAETMCAWFGGNMYTWGGVSFNTVPSAQSVFAVGTRVGATNYENHIFFGNGATIPYKYNGTEFTRHGVYAPTSANIGATATARITSNGAGVLTANGQYQYKFTFVNSQLVESDIGEVTATFTVSASSGQNRINSIPVAPQSFGVQYRRVYRNASGAPTVFKRVTEIADNTTTTYDDNVADSALGVTAPTDKGVPPNYSFILYHQNRLFMNDPSNPNYLWYTDLGEPYTVAALNFIKAGDAAGDIVRGAAVYDDSIIIFCENSAWIVYMPSTTASEWKVVKAKMAYGSKSPYCMLQYENKLLFVALQGGKIVGFAALQGDTVAPSASLLSVSSAGSEMRSDRIETDIFEIQSATFGDISGIVYQNNAYITVPYGSGATANNRVYVMDFSISNLAKKQHESWVPWTGIAASQFTIYSGNLYFGSATANGRVYRMTPGTYSDDGSAINSYFWTKEFSGFDDEINYQKDFRYANILVDLPGDYYMNLLYRVDSDSGSGNTKQIDLNPGGSLWGTMVWGEDTWGGGSLQNEFRVFLDGLRGKRIQFKFTNQNTVGQKFKVHGLNFAYNRKGYR